MMPSMANMEPDKIRHLKWGGGLAVALAAVVALALLAGPGWAIAGGAVLFGIGVEVYQKARSEGAASWADAAASAAPGVALGLVVEALRLTL